MDSDYVSTLANSCVGQMYTYTYRYARRACIVYIPQLCRVCGLRESRADAIMPNFHRAQCAGGCDYYASLRFNSTHLMQRFFFSNIAIDCRYEITGIMEK